MPKVNHDKEAALTHERLTELLWHDIETGDFINLKRRNWIAKAGNTAGTKTPNGYIQIQIDGSLYMAHRLVFFYHRKVWPPQFVDHVNGVKDDNRPENLRFASKSQNAANSKMKADNASGYRGVHWDQSKGKWTAQIRKNADSRFIGRFNTPKEAAHAYDWVAHQLFGEFARLNFPDDLRPIAAYIGDTNKSGYRGVYWEKRSKKWRANVKKNGQRYYLGRFDDAVEAAHAYDAKVKELDGDRARLNFPSEADRSQR